jgi:hypothetical protein
MKEFLIRVQAKDPKNTKAKMMVSKNPPLNGTPV